jgi:hypothetical protein
VRLKPTPSHRASDNPQPVTALRFCHCLSHDEALRIRSSKTAEADDATLGEYHHRQAFHARQHLTKCGTRNYAVSRTSLGTLRSRASSRKWSLASLPKQSATRHCYSALISGTTVQPEASTALRLFRHSRLFNMRNSTPHYAKNQFCATTTYA